MTVKATFEAMELADDLCEKAGNPPGLFMALMPTPILRGMLPRLYESHARELVDRWSNKGDLCLGTKAEVLAGLMNTSLKAPLNSSGLALYEKLFRECTGSDVDTETLGREDYPGQLDEILSDSRRKLRVEERWGD